MPTADANFTQIDTDFLFFFIPVNFAVALPARYRYTEHKMCVSYNASPDFFVKE